MTPNVSCVRCGTTVPRPKDRRARCAACGTALPLFDDDPNLPVPELPLPDRPPAPRQPPPAVSPLLAHSGALPEATEAREDDWSDFTLEPSGEVPLGAPTASAPRPAAATRPARRAVTPLASIAQPGAARPAAPRPAAAPPAPRSPAPSFSGARGEARSSRTPLVLVALAIAALGGGAALLLRSGDAPTSQAPAAPPMASPPAVAQAPQPPPPPAAAPAPAPATALAGPPARAPAAAPAQPRVLPAAAPAQAVAQGQAAPRAAAARPPTPAGPVVLAPATPAPATPAPAAPARAAPPPLAPAIAPAPGRTLAPATADPVAAPRPADPNPAPPPQPAAATTTPAAPAAASLTAMAAATVAGADPFRRPRLLEPTCIQAALRLPRDANTDGATIRVRFSVGLDGRPTDVAFVDRSVDFRVENAMRQAILGCRFVPGTDGHGAPSVQQVVMPFRFDAR